MSEENVKKVETKNKRALDANKSSVMSFIVSSRFLAVLAVLGIASAAYFFMQYQDIRDNPADVVATRNQEESDRVLGTLGDVILLGEEKATVAKIEDPKVLKESNPEFYTNAESGDYLILYPARAIIFREDESKIINVAPIVNTDNINNNSTDNSNKNNEESN